MKPHRYTRAWLLSFLKAVGLATLFLLPFTLAATPPPDQGTAALPSDPPTPPNPNAYAPDVQQLIETTYLGRGKEFPDPEEPAIVLRKYLGQNAHGYHAQLAKQNQKLNAELAEWQALTRQYPQSRHAFVALGKYYRTKAQVSGDIEDLRQAADAYIEAADIGLAHRRIRYTRELSELLVELGDRKGLDEIFGRMLAQPKESDRNSYYLALVDYADGLARFRDDRAWDYFEEVIDFHPENNEAAINRYARYLLDSGHGQKAFELLDTRLTPEHRVGSLMQASLRKEAMEQIGLDTTSADAEIALILQRRGEGPMRGRSFFPFSSTADTEATVATLAPPDSRLTFVAAQAVADDRVSSIFGVLLNNPSTPPNPDPPNIQQDAIFIPNGAMNNRWPDMKPVVTGKKLAAIKWPIGKAGLFRIGTDNAVYYRYYNGSSWGSWQALASGSAVDITAVVWPNGQADVFRVDGNQCDVYVSHSTDGQTWGAWNWWGSCGDQIAVSVMPNGTAWALLRTPYLVSQHVAVKRYFNGSAWDNFWVFFPDPQVSVNDIDLLAYPNPGSGSKMIALAIGSDNCGLYFRDWNGSTWTNWALAATCFKKVSSFSTSDGGAYMLLIGRDNDYLYTNRFTGSAWSGISQPQGSRTWIATAGINIDEDQPYEHTQNSDDCRTQTVCLVNPKNSAECITTDGINWAEVMYNEARSETIGAQAVVGWTVRNRAYQGLSCDSYPGAQGGGTLTTTCRNTVPCSDPNYCDDSKRVCCVIHGGQTQLGTSGHQFNDEHVDMNTLALEGFLDREWHIAEGRLLDMSNPGWKPAGTSGCPNPLTCGTETSGGPLCTSGFNITEVPLAGGPMEFLNFTYTPAASSCKRVTGFVCGDTNDPNNNYFWNRKP